MRTSILLALAWLLNGCGMDPELARSLIMAESGIYALNCEVIGMSNLAYMTRNDARRRVKAIDREIKTLCQDLSRMDARREKMNAKDGDFTEVEEDTFVKLVDDIEALQEEINELEREKTDLIEEHFEPDPKHRPWEIMP